MLVELRDAETGTIYQIELSREEWERCDNDLRYAQQLLEEAKESIENTIVNFNNTDENTSEMDKHTWSYDDTLKLISIVESHYDELLAINPRTKKRGWENIVNNLLSAEIVVTVNEVKKKWTNLVQTYNKVKDIKTKTGRGPTRFNFFEKIDDILGNKPTNCSPHSYNVGSLNKNLATKQKEIPVKENNYEVRNIVEVRKPLEAFTSNIKYSDEEGSSTNSSTPISLKNTRNRRTPNQEYIKAKISYLRRKELHLERIELSKKQKKEEKEEKQHEKEALLKKKMDLEERKVKALEDYVALRKEEKCNWPSFSK